MEKMKMHTPDLTQDNIAKLAALFPNCVTEARDAQGKLKKSVDFDQLRQELSGVIVEGPQERYRLDWPGKREALLAANAPIAKTLRPCREESVDFDTTKNLFIEGDNLEALKLLQETYLGKAKLVFIDPPYNTGKDFIYDDNFASESSEYLSRSVQIDSTGNRLVLNTESNGRFHSDWLSMVFSRLRLARNLLCDSGFIFITIDDNEVANLRLVTDEIFGADNFIANLVWQKKYTRANDAKWFSDNHDHILCYSKNKVVGHLNLLPRTEEQTAAYSNPDNHPKGPWKATPLHAKSGSNTSEYVFKNGMSWKPPTGTFRRFSNDTMMRMDDEDEIWFGSDGTQTPSRKSFLGEVKDGLTPVTIWPYDEVGHNHEANNELKELNLKGVFDNPKPTRLLSRILKLSTEKDDLIIDFFSGSGTTGHAVMQENSNDGGARRFILVQVAVDCEAESEASRVGFKSIADITKERVRRAGQKILTDHPLTGSLLDVGFRVLKIDTSNLEPVFYSPEGVKQESLLAHIENIRPGRTSEDLLFQVLLDWGVDLALPIQRETLAGKEVFFVDETALAACFEGGIEEEFVKALAKRKPLRVVFRDAGFADDAVKINVGQIFKSLSPDTEVKVI